MRLASHRSTKPAPSCCSDWWPAPTSAAASAWPATGPSRTGAGSCQFPARPPRCSIACSTTPSWWSLPVNPGASKKRAYEHLHDLPSTPPGQRHPTHTRRTTPPSDLHPGWGLLMATGGYRTWPPVGTSRWPLTKRFEDEVDPDRQLPEQERLRRA